MTQAAYYSESYAQARKGFLAAAHACGARIESISAQTETPVDPAPFTDAAHLGDEDALRSLVVVSGTHGPEGLTGSACQRALLDDISDSGLPADTSVLLVHAVNAWGVATGLRCTEEGVDLNRNYAEFDNDNSDNNDKDALKASNPEYDAMHDYLHRLADSMSAQAYLACGPSMLTEQFGEGAVNILFQGQHRHANGAGFGGFAPTAARQRLERALTSALSASRDIAVVDLHTGLGPHAVGMKFSVAETGGEEAQRVKSWYGDDVVLTNDADANLPYRIFGETSSGVARALPNARITGLTLEYGTYEVDGLVRCILAEFLIRHRIEMLEEGMANKLTGKISAFFYPESAAWRQRVIAQARAVFSQAFVGLAGSIQSA